MALWPLRHGAVEGGGGWVVVVVEDRGGQRTDGEGLERILIVWSRWLGVYLSMGKMHCNTMTRMREGEREKEDE